MSQPEVEPAHPSSSVGAPLGVLITRGEVGPGEEMRPPRWSGPLALGPGKLSGVTVPLQGLSHTPAASLPGLCPETQASPGHLLHTPGQHRFALWAW